MELILEKIWYRVVKKKRNVKNLEKTEKSLCPKFTNRYPAKMEKSFYICVQTLKNAKKMI